jgi:hypothetical protein
LSVLGEALIFNTPLSSASCTPPHAAPTPAWERLVTSTHPLTHSCSPRHVTSDQLDTYLRHTTLSRCVTIITALHVLGYSALHCSALHHPHPHPPTRTPTHPPTHARTRTHTWRYTSAAAAPSLSSSANRYASKPPTYTCAAYNVTKCNHITCAACVHSCRHPRRKLMACADTSLHVARTPSLPPTHRPAAHLSIFPSGWSPCSAGRLCSLVLTLCLAATRTICGFTAACRLYEAQHRI